MKRKQINAQWVFLIICILWIPVLAFGYEVDGVEFSGPPVPIPVEDGIMFLIWLWGAIAFIAMGAVAALFLTVVGIWQSLRFNYHLYVTHGQFAFWAVESNTTEYKNRLDIAMKIGQAKDPEKLDTDMTFLAWWPVLIVVTVIWFAFAIGSVLWPVVLFLGLPFFLIRSIALKKRKKQVFVDKLKDNDTNGIV